MSIKYDVPKIIPIRSSKRSWISFYIMRVTGSSLALSSLFPTFSLTFLYLILFFSFSSYPFFSSFFIFCIFFSNYLCLPFALYMYLFFYLSLSLSLSLSLPGSIEHGVAWNSASVFKLFDQFYLLGSVGSVFIQI